MTTREAFARRLAFAFQQWGHRLGRVPSKKELAEAVAAGMRRKRIGASTIGAWFDGARPEPEVGVVLADVLGVDVGWLYFNGYTRVPAPAGWDTFGADSTATESGAAAARLAEQGHEALQRAEAEAARRRGAQRPTGTQ